MPRDATADRARAAELITELRQDRAQLRTAIQALPASGARTPAQRRDALMLRTLSNLVAFTVITSGAADVGDREPTEA